VPDRKPARAEIVARLWEIALNPPTPAELAAREAARTDPWRWYCRECGATGEDQDPGARDWEAGEHLRTTRCGRNEVVGMDWFGRTLHVWTYPRSAVTRWN
jgi:hypothetical protein